MNYDNVFVYKPVNDRTREETAKGAIIGLGLLVIGFLIITAIVAMFQPTPTEPTYNVYAQSLSK
jgi:hypothetical protein